MGEPARAEISLKIAEKLAPEGLNKIGICRQEIANIKVTPKKKSLIKPTPAGGENSNLHGASNLVKLVETPDRGKFIVANEGLKTGDVVLSEEPVAACLVPNFFGSHCHNCFARFNYIRVHLKILFFKKNLFLG